MQSFEEDKNWLEELVGTDLPKEIAEMSPENLHAVRLFVESFYNEKMKSIKKAISANEVTLKFIPNFILFQIIKKFLDPSAAALVAESISVSLITPIVSGLEPDYIAETAVFLNAERASEIFEKLEKRKLNQILEYLEMKKPMKVLDILHHIAPEKIRQLQVRLNRDMYEDHPLSETRKKVFDIFFL